MNRWMDATLDRSSAPGGLEFQRPSSYLPAAAVSTASVVAPAALEAIAFSEISSNLGDAVRTIAPCCGSAAAMRWVKADVFTSVLGRLERQFHSGTHAPASVRTVAAAYVPPLAAGYVATSPGCIVTPAVLRPTSSPGAAAEGVFSAGYTLNATGLFAWNGTSGGGWARLRPSMSRRGAHRCATSAAARRRAVPSVCWGFHDERPIQQRREGCDAPSVRDASPGAGALVGAVLNAACGTAAFDAAFGAVAFGAGFGAARDPVAVARADYCGSAFSASFRGRPS